MIYILGCDHWLQPAEILDVGDEVRELAERNKRSFSAEIRAIIQPLPLGFVGEECRDNEDTIARLLAAELGWQYRMIDIPGQQRATYGIPETYETVYKANLSEILRCHLIRERYMFERVQAYRGEAANVLAIVGSEHVGRLAKLFTDNGDEVQCKDVTNSSWFDPPWRHLHEF
jgi:hypothetical protein